MKKIFAVKVISWMVMNMIQIDIKMPTCCSDCPLVRYSPWGTFCNLNSDIVSIENLKTYSKASKPDWCPLKEVGDEHDYKTQG